MKFASCINSLFTGVMGQIFALLREEKIQASEVPGGLDDFLGISAISHPQTSLASRF